ncbi:DUF2147 domain-containing protein [Sulfidibacter corallicola]|uniref:DUF2147 domain-containing protein n=1 Tax=Sulfidibacter corallicola TaxID=2818388 RepID=A0A8A4TRL4_SULCO|nr:DUF2147 domain-containing protein [Sulfidibacter corallicola]QTD52037.1 DUF2147 domain-containing protein [Sulfidibacter corallicola]
MSDQAKKIGWVFVLAALASFSPAWAEDGDAIVGVWFTDNDDSKVEIFKCGEQYCGKIIWLKEPIYAADDEMAGQPKVDRENGKKKLRNRPIVGLEIMTGFTFEEGEWSGGKIYDPEKGKTYKCRMELSSDGALNVRGYIGIPALGRTTKWTRKPQNEMKNENG